MSGDFTWQTGQPLSAQILDFTGNSFYPFGRNTLRFPVSRQLNFGLRRPFQTADKKLNVEPSIQVFNLLNQLNVFGGFGRFEVPPGVTNPEQFPPLRPKVLPTDIDVSRSFELGMTISF